jgi:hypothetical protein
MLEILAQKGDAVKWMQVVYTSWSEKAIWLSRSGTL